MSTSPNTRTVRDLNRALAISEDCGSGDLDLSSSFSSGSSSSARRKVNSKFGAVFGIVVIVIWGATPQFSMIGRREEFWSLARSEERCGRDVHERRATKPGAKRTAPVIKT